MIPGEEERGREEKRVERGGGLEEKAGEIENIATGETSQDISLLSLFSLLWLLTPRANHG